MEYSKLHKYLKGKSCRECGFEQIVALDFHHRDPKEKINNVSYLVQCNKSSDIINSEIEKCDILCGNCHAIITVESMRKNNTHQANLDKWYKYTKKLLFCKHCGENRSESLQFHHVNPKRKYKEVSTMVHENYPILAIIEEMDKCICLCCNCHRILHATKRQLQ